MEKVKLAVEDALISTYRKIKERTYSNSEIAGLFVNYYYRNMNIHGGLDTRGFSVVKHEDKIIVLSVKESYWHHESKEVLRILEDMTQADFYSLYLRSSFEDPINDYYGVSGIKDVFDEYHSYRAESKKNSIF